jgi:hypothetical protein
MRKVLIGVAACVLIAAVPVMAGDYHSGATLNCSECHVMHQSQTHGYNANGGGIYAAVGGDAPYERLLRNNINDLCLTCHDGQMFAPDVLGATSASIVRQAGALNRDNASPYFDADGHTLGSNDIAPGGTWNNADGLECTDCHTAHGSGNTSVPNPYRNLRASGNTGSSYRFDYAIGTNDLSKAVFERSATSGGTHYATSNVDFNEPSQDSSRYAVYCQKCHTNFHGSQGDGNMYDAVNGDWLRHPTADADLSGSRLTNFKNKLHRPKMMTNANDWGTQGVAWAAAPTDLTPSCFTCHKAHGNTNAFGLIYPTGAAPIDEDGDGTSTRDQCKACHTQGG